MLENSRAKLEKKHLDMIIANNLKVSGVPDSEPIQNVITMITKEEGVASDIMTKAEAAKQILDKILEKLYIDMILLISKDRDGFWNVHFGITNIRFYVYQIMF